MTAYSVGQRVSVLVSRSYWNGPQSHFRDVVEKFQGEIRAIGNFNGCVYYFVRIDGDIFNTAIKASQVVSRITNYSSSQEPEDDCL